MTSYSNNTDISVLAVVQDPVLVDDLKTALSDYRFSAFGTPEEALTDIFDQDHIPDVILLGLPEAEARRFSHTIHEDKHLALVPLLLLYDIAEAPDPSRLIALGTSDIIPFPLQHDQLIGMIHKHEQTRRHWWDSFHIAGAQKPERILNALHLARSKSRPQPSNTLGLAGDHFPSFRQQLYRKSGLSRDRIKFLQPYTSSQVYQLGAALYLDTWQVAAAMSEFLHLPLLESINGYQASLGAMPAAFCRKNLVLPLKDAHDRQVVAIANPFQLEVVDIVNKLFKHYTLAVMPPELIESVLNPEFKNTEAWRHWIALRHVRSQEQRQSGTSAAQILPHHLPPTRVAPVTRLEDNNPVQDADVVAQTSLDYFYRGSVRQADDAPVDLSQLKDQDLSDDQVEIPESNAILPDSIANEREAQAMEARLMRAYQAYRDKKMSETVSGSALASLIEGDRDPEVAPIIHLVNTLIEQAHLQGASDIHFEPWENEVVVRYRIDGTLHVVHRLQPRAIIRPIVARLKIMSQLDISERRLPQDGQIRFVEYSPAHDISLRLALAPMAYGEKAVLRLLDRKRSIVPLEEMGFTPENLSLYRHLINAPYGMILHVGPTGSGKTTTLYAALNEINDPDLNIQTIENPIEYMLDGINQLETKSEIGLDFKRALRSYLRQDPDVIMVGEIRDEETAHIAVEASLTGHLLFSTLHTNDAASTIIRLVEMGIRPYMLTSSLLLICAQRLLRRLCTHCRKPFEADAGVKHLLGLPEAQPLQLYAPAGCELCHDSGYHGRIGIYEMLAPDDALRLLMAQPEVDAQQIKAQAMANGMRTLFQDAAAKVIAGQTSLEELTLNILNDA